MGRKKIQISRITDERNRQVTFNKRKFGVMKKAYELSVLCDCEIALIIFSSSNKLYQYASTDMDKVLLKYTEYNEPHESLTNKNIIEALNKKEHKNGMASPDSPDNDTDYTLTPRTEAKYNKIDEEFNIMLQKSNQINGGRTPMGNYNNISVSVPVNNSNYDPSLMQPSPQMSHSSLSPRPGSSSGMLDMNGSNGYPGSTSPLPQGGIPSPAHLVRPHSSKTHSPTRPQLRVLIPNSQLTTNRNGSPTPTLNTPVVSSLQTAGGGVGIAGGGGSTHTMYSPINSSFNHSDFPLNSDISSLNTLNTLQQDRDDTDYVASLQWNTTSISQLGISHHSLPHVSISSSTPPPQASSPPLRIKAEPISPPRDPLSGHSHHLQRPSSADPGHLSPAPPSHITHSSLQQSHSIFPASSTSHHEAGLHRPHLFLDSGHLTPTSHASPEPSHHNEYESSPLSKRPRLSEGWTT